MLTFQGVATPTLLSILAGAGGIAIAAGTAADMLLQRRKFRRIRILFSESENSSICWNKFLWYLSGDILVQIC